MLILFLLFVSLAIALVSLVNARDHDLPPDRLTLGAISVAAALVLIALLQLPVACPPLP